MTKDNFKELIVSVLDRDTSAHPEQWTWGNPFWGHCTVVSLLAQDIFGGDIMRVDLSKVPGFENIKWHSWNRLPDGEEIDFTKSQFHKKFPENLKPWVADRTQLFSYGGIEKRYLLLKERFDKFINKKFGK